MTRNRPLKEIERKHVHYRARHKKLEHLKERMTEHGFKERIVVEDPQIQASEPKYCSVLLDNTEAHVIKMTRKNYVSASSKLDDIVYCNPNITVSSDATQSVETYGSCLDKERLQIFERHQQPIPDTPENRHVLPEQGYEAAASIHREMMWDHDWRVGRSHSGHTITQSYPTSASSWFVADAGKEVWDMSEYELPTDGRSCDLQQNSSVIFGSGIVSGGLPMIPDSNHTAQLQTPPFPYHEQTMNSYQYLTSPADMPWLSQTSETHPQSPVFYTNPDI